MDTPTVRRLVTTPRPPCGPARRTALGIAATRLALGALAVAAPRAVARPWIGDEAGGHGAAVLGRALGGRDVALGAGLLVAARRGAPIRGWAEAAVLADLVDTAATLCSFGRLATRGRWLVLACAGGAAVAGALASGALAE